MNQQEKQEVKEKFFKIMGNEVDVDALADDEIRQMESQIKYYDPFVGKYDASYDKEAAIREYEIQTTLKARLKELSTPKPKLAPRQASKTRCDCGHYDEYPMTTSTGTSCPDCYDRMS